MFTPPLAPACISPAQRALECAASSRRFGFLVRMEKRKGRDGLCRQSGAGTHRTQKVLRTETGDVGRGARIPRALGI